MWPIFGTEYWMAFQLTLCVVVAFFVMLLPTRQLLNGTRVRAWVWVFALALALYIGLRPTNLYFDSELYSTIYFIVSNGSWPAVPPSPEIFFNATEQMFINWGAHCSWWFFWIALWYVMGMAVAARRFMPRHMFLTFLLLISAFSFWGYATNGLRHGMASSIALVGLSFFMKSRRDLWMGMGLMVLAVLTHTAMALTLACALFALRWRNVKWSVAIWVACCVIAFLLPDVVTDFLASMDSGGKDRMGYYATQATDKAGLFSRTGYRWDFLLYSAVPIAIGWLLVVKDKVHDEMYTFLLNVYIYANSFWVLINTVAYSNRFAYLSWFIYPLLLAYPFFKIPVMKYQGFAAGVMIIFFSLFTFLM